MKPGDNVYLLTKGKGDDFLISLETICMAKFERNHHGFMVCTHIQLKDEYKSIIPNFGNRVFDSFEEAYAEGVKQRQTNL